MADQITALFQEVNLKSNSALRCHCPISSEGLSRLSDGLTVTPGFISTLRNQITVSHHFNQIAFNG